MKIGSRPSSKQSFVNRSSDMHLLTGANRASAGFRPPRSQLLDYAAFRQSNFKHHPPGRGAFVQSNRSAWKPKRNHRASVHHHNVNQFAVPELQNGSVLASVRPPVQEQDAGLDCLNLDLNLGPSNNASVVSNAGAPPMNLTPSAPVLCRRCHSSSHPRHACKAPIKCDNCFGWGHVAVSCHEN